MCVGNHAMRLVSCLAGDVVFSLIKDGDPALSAREDLERLTEARWRGW